MAKLVPIFLEGMTPEGEDLFSVQGVLMSFLVVVPSLVMMRKT